MTIIEDWSTMGLVATASHFYEVKYVKVDFNQAFSIDTKVLQLTI